ncbi:PHD and RING finger domain-containing protein 1 [Drosophila santomea]|uniref:PHD and RING finger domain-containing protein 1 n=1 Tax=Drosophila santomea TaxID=129105 RepID=UPI001952FA58|nr:PHD and RING finger domain-containing protein 1 [Drosophila santomea]
MSDRDSESDASPPLSHQRGQRNRRIIMRIEFKDSEDTASDHDLDERPSCSTATRLRPISRRQEVDSDSASVPRKSRRKLRSRYGPRSDCSSSGSEIDHRATRCSKRKKVESSDEEETERTPSTVGRLQPTPADPDNGFSSDSSSNDLLEKCPICLLTFRQQEIGTPATCEHIFCAACIDAWSRNVQTCPIDRISFDRIVVRDSYASRQVVREVRVDLSKSKTELVTDEDADAAAVSEEEVTNCEICESPEREDVMLLCDSCNQGYHMDCLEPQLHEIPAGSWYCDNCIDSDGEDDNEELELADDLSQLYDDIRGMGLPETRLRVREVQEPPRILRTRQNERIRAAVLRRTRSGAASAEDSTLTRTRTRTTTTTTTTTTTSRRTTTSTNKRPVQRRRRRRTRQRTYVVEYDLNNFDEKFALKTSKKVIRRRRRRRRRGVATASSEGPGRRLTASKRLAEQMGVKSEGVQRSHLSGGTASSFSLFGNANDLEYFSDSDPDVVGNISSAGLGSTAVQTTVRIASIGAPRIRTALLQGKARIAAPPLGPTAAAAGDILSTIMDLQDRWHDASRNLGEVHIRADGTLNLPHRPALSTKAAPAPMTGVSKTEEHLTQAPLYQRGGGGPNFNRGGGAGSSDSFNNRYSGNNSYRGGGAGGGGGGDGGSGGGGGVPSSSGGASSRQLTGGGDGQGGGGFSNQNFSSPSANNNSNSNVSSFTPFHLRFNTPNRQQQARQQPNQTTPPFRGSAPHPAPVASSSNSFSVQTPMFAPPVNHHANPVMGMPVVLSIPPPPMPPASLPWNSPLFKMNPLQQAPVKPNDRNKNEDVDNCPNFSIYSQESQAVANASAMPSGVSQGPADSSDKDDDDMNEDLVQLDDDDEDTNIPLPLGPEPEPVPEKVHDDDLYEPENPTEEPDESEMVEESCTTVPKEKSESSDHEPCNSIVGAAPSGEKDTEEAKMRSTPSPLVKEDRVADRDRGKGVLELYDDSDWEELDIDKPKEFEKALVAETEAQASPKTAPPKRPALKKDASLEKEANASGSEHEQDRSYTPCLDEKNLADEEEAGAAHKNNSRTSPKPRLSKASDDEDEPEKAIGTDIQSEDELNNENVPKRRSRSRGQGNNEKSKSKSRSKRNKAETFKKVGKRQKDRNYRGDKPEPDRSPRSGSRSLTPKIRSKSPRVSKSISRSRSGSRSISKSKSKSRTRSRSRSRSPSRNRNRRRRNSRSKSYSRSHSRSRSRSNSHSRQRFSFRGRDHQRGFIRGRGGLRFNYRNQQYHNRPFQHYGQNYHQNQNYHNQHQQYFHYNQHGQQQQFFHRPKRRELPRYDVRNVVGASRHQPQAKDRYGRDAMRSHRSRSGRRNSRSFSRSVSRDSRGSLRSGSPKRRSFSISPTPPPGTSPSPHKQGVGRRTSPSRRYVRSPSPVPSPPNERLHSPVQSVHSRGTRSHTPNRINGDGNRSPLYMDSPRYTPRLSRSRSRSRSASPKDLPKKKKRKSDKKKKKKRTGSGSPTTAARMRRISRQRDPFEDADDFLAPQRKRKKGGMPTGQWSPSPSPGRCDFLHDSAVQDKNPSWTPPLGSPKGSGGHYNNDGALTPKKTKRKRDKSKKKKKQHQLEKPRKEKKRKRRTQTPEPLPSKEVFASGNNILVSVSFNKDSTTNNASATLGSQQQSVVAIPPGREDLLSNRMASMASNSKIGSAVGAIKKTKRKRKKLEAKPVAIIDLERSPFQVHQEPADVIVLTDSEDATDPLSSRRERERDRDHDLMRENGQREKTPQVGSLDAIMETSYENMTQSTGPKTPPEPPLVKFSLPTKKLQHKVRNNPLHEDVDDINSADELEASCSMAPEEQTPQHGHASHDGGQKIGPNTPPESGPCSPDAYDPFEPTKSPSLSPRSPTPTMGQNLEQQTASVPASGATGSGSVDKGESDGTHVNVSNASTSTQTQTNALNPVDLVMALMNKPNQSGPIQQESEVSSAQYISSSSVSLSVGVGSSTGGSLGGAGVADSHDKSADGKTITVLSNVLLTSSSVVSSSQHIPSISSPTPPSKKLTPLPKAGGSVASSSSGVGNMPTTSSGIGGPRNGSGLGNAGGSSNALDDSFNMDIESPYSPGSADYEDLFEPPIPMEGSRRAKGGATGGKVEIFDNLFGSSSPVGNIRMSSRYNTAVGKKSHRSKADRKSKVKGSRNPDLYDDVPNSATDLQNKDKLLRKLNRQERVVEEVKLVLKPYFNKNAITKDDYKDIMRRAVPKICHSRSGEINPHKIKNLIDAYVKKFRAKHKKLSLLNTGQVSSAVKCAAYLKKL